jgi:hypothetical protein
VRIKFPTNGALLREWRAGFSQGRLAALAEAAPGADAVLVMPEGEEVAAAVGEAGALAADPPWRDAVMGAVVLAELEGPDDTPLEIDDDAPDEDAPPPPPGDGDDDGGVPLNTTELFALPVTEKMKIAIGGPRGARLLLARDPNKVIHMYLLKNPRISADEVAYLASQTQANIEALTEIAKNQAWMQNYQVVINLVRNPKTPSPLAIKLLDKLKPSDLRQLAKSSKLKPPVLHAARKKVVGP